MKLPPLVGITGLAGVGKDTLADELVRAHGYLKHSMAAPLKAGLNAIFGFEESDWLDRAWKERKLPRIGKSPRELAQSLGTEWGRGVSEELWLQIAQEKWKRLWYGQRGDARMVVPDVRFENEARWVLGCGGVIVEIVRPGVAPVVPHVSEAGIPRRLVALAISNDKSIEAFVHSGIAAIAWAYDNRHGVDANGSPTDDVPLTLLPEKF